MANRLLAVTACIRSRSTSSVETTRMSPTRRRGAPAQEMHLLPPEAEHSARKTDFSRLVAVSLVSPSKARASKAATTAAVYLPKPGLSLYNVLRAPSTKTWVILKSCAIQSSTVDLPRLLPLRTALLPPVLDARPSAG